MTDNPVLQAAKTRNITFVERILASRGNCNNLDCQMCPIPCTRCETKQATMIRAKIYIAGVKHA